MARKNRTNIDVSKFVRDDLKSVKEIYKHKSEPDTYETYDDCIEKLIRYYKILRSLVFTKKFKNFIYKHAKINPKYKIFKRQIYG